MKRPMLSKLEARALAHEFMAAHNYHEGWIMRELLDDNDNALDPEREPIWEFLIQATGEGEYDFLVFVGSRSKEVTAYCPFNLVLEHTSEPLH